MSNAAFFYGTLMATEIIGDVLCGKAAPADIKRKKLNSLQLSNALLTRHRRYAVKHATYPGLLESNNGTDEVHGVLCEGLTLRDVEALDDYEGDEYQRRITKVIKQTETDNLEQQEKTVSCQVYLWIAGKEQLKDQDWDYEHWRKYHLPYTVI